MYHSLCSKAQVKHPFNDIADYLSLISNQEVISLCLAVLKFQIQVFEIVVHKLWQETYTVNRLGHDLNGQVQAERPSFF